MGYPSKISYLLVLLVLGITFPSYGQPGLNPPLVTGTILNQTDSTPLANISVINMRTHTGSISYADGQFAVHAIPGDSIKFSAIGMKTLYWEMHGSSSIDSLKIFLNKSQYELGTVVIGAMNKRKFRDDFLNHVPDDSMPITLNLPPQPKHIPLEQTAAYPRAKYTGLGLGFGWSFTLEQMQKSYKSIHKWQQKEAVSATAAKRYSPELVKRLTGISEKDIESFMKFCNMQPDVIAKSSDYELGETIKKCYLAYQEQQSNEH